MPFMGITRRPKKPFVVSDEALGIEPSNSNPPKEEKKRIKKIIHFNGKDWIKCDQCGTMTSEVPCHKCGGPPVKDLDTLWNAETVNEDKPKHVTNEDAWEIMTRGNPYFVQREGYYADGGVSCRIGGRIMW